MKQNEERITLQKVLERIQCADDCEVSQIIETLIKRYQLVFPGWEVVFLSVPRGAGREEMIRATMDYLQRQEPSEKTNRTDMASKSDV